MLNNKTVLAGLQPVITFTGKGRRAGRGANIFPVLSTPKCAAL